VYSTLSTQAGLKQAFAKLNSIYKNLVFTTSGAQSVQYVIDRQCDMGITWSGRPALRLKDDPSLPLAVTWKDAMINGAPLVIVKGAPHDQAALSLIAFGSTPDRVCKQFNELSYGIDITGPPFPGCLTQFGQDWRPHYDEAYSPLGNFYGAHPNIEEQWTAWQTGSH
jgi:putative spermidine/putrescine transport system substrate-binding protein